MLWFLLAVAVLVAGANISGVWVRATGGLGLWEIPGDFRWCWDCRVAVGDVLLGSEYDGMLERVSRSMSWGGLGGVLLILCVSVRKTFFNTPLQREVKVSSETGWH